ncbi:hypothetical protein D6833_08225 [Candidatus Parcubacteria bacterium]|nr:MAG: hypothetical protein D6833_08225 [Candidatus Parcubacteria bacterium]
MRHHSVRFVTLFLFTGLAVFFLACQGAGDRAGASKDAQAKAATPEQRLENIRTELAAVKADLAKKGEYNCCIQPTCNWCALHEGGCECYDNLKAGEEVCPGCGLGWHNGQGVAPGIEASQVKWAITHEHGEEGEEHHH